jgi:hypothetical protein
MEKQKRQILADLEYISSQKRTVDLVANFRGVPISVTADVIRCSQTTGGVRLRLHHHQIHFLKTVDKILINSDLFRSLLIGELTQIDLHTNILTLERLRYVTGSMGNRKNMRVQPESPIHVEIIMGHGYSVQGEMIDISREGLSVRLVKDDFPEDNLFILQIPVEIRLGLPVSGKAAIHDLAFQGMIAYTNESQQTYRVGLLAFLKEPDLGILRRYIFDRQTELLHEIQQMDAVEIHS